MNQTSSSNNNNNIVAPNTKDNTTTIVKPFLRSDRNSDNGAEKTPLLTNQNFIKPPTHFKTWYQFIASNLLVSLTTNVSTIFYVVNAIYAAIPGIESPFLPLVSVAPLLIVLILPLLRGCYLEFWMVHRATIGANSDVYEQAFSSSSPTTTPENENNKQKQGTNNHASSTTIVARDLVVGDVIKIKNGQQIPADVLLIDVTSADHSSTSSSCHIDMVNLTGSTAFVEKYVAQLSRTTTSPNKSNSNQADNLRSLLSSSSSSSPIEIQIDDSTLAKKPTITEHGTMIKITHHNNSTVEVSASSSLLPHSAVLRGPVKSIIAIVLRIGENTAVSRTSNLEDSMATLSTFASSKNKKKDENDNTNNKSKDEKSSSCSSSSSSSTNHIFGSTHFPKWSSLHSKLNRLTTVIIIIQHIVLFIIAGVSVNFVKSKEEKNLWYAQSYIKEEINDASGCLVTLFFKRYVLFFITLPWVVPISMFVTLEVAKQIQGKVMEWDHEMTEWMFGKWVTCQVLNSNMNEDLSQVKFIFSDKTGTLTENVMRYSLGDALGIAIDADDFEQSKAAMTDERMQRYMRALGLCHTIQPFEDEDSPSGLKYDGASPDEIALVSTAVTHGVELRERFTRSMKLRYNETGKELDYEILATLEFTPDRKMMSIVVRNPENGKIEVYTKGADTAVLVRTKGEQSRAREAVDSLNKKGLRCCVFVTRELSQQQFDSWNSKLNDAKCQIENRNEKIRQVYDELETDFELLGIAGLSYTIQEDVNETLKFFQDAGVKCWMVSGDPSTDSCVTTAFSCGILNPDHDFVQLSVNLHGNPDEGVSDLQNQLDNITKDLYHNPLKKMSMLVPEIVFRKIVTNENLSTSFAEIALFTHAGVCTGFSPTQKAQLVTLIQNHKRCQEKLAAASAAGDKSAGEEICVDFRTTLAIGDGANDIPMLAAARIGVAVLNEQHHDTRNNAATSSGLQHHSFASTSADYVIPRFKNLHRLLAVHGRTSIYRNTKCILFSLYKSFIIVTALIVLNLYKGVGGVSIFDGLLLTIYNIIFLSIPPALVAFFGKDCPEELSLTRPELYTQLSRDFYYNRKQIIAWSLEAILHAIVVFFVMFEFIWHQDLSAAQGQGRTADQIVTSSMFMSAVIFMTLGKWAVEIRYFQPGIALSFVLTTAIYFIYLTVYSNIELIRGSTGFLGVAFTMWRQPKFWLFNIVCTFGLLSVDLFTTSLYRHVLNRHILYDFDEEEFLSKLKKDCEEKKEEKEKQKKLKVESCRFSTVAECQSRKKNDSGSGSSNTAAAAAVIVATNVIGSSDTADQEMSQIPAPPVQKFVEEKPADENEGENNNKTTATGKRASPPGDSPLSDYLKKKKKKK